MASKPGKAFSTVDLDMHVIGTGARFGRIYHGRYPDPMGIGKSGSRFSDPRRRPAHRRFGVLYLGVSAKVCFIEAVLRDQRDNAVADWPVAESELRARRYADIGVASPLRLVDLRGDAPIRMGIPSDVRGAASHDLSRAWSVAMHDHPSMPDGIIYPSRLSQQINLAIYDRAISKLRLIGHRPLIDLAELPDILDSLKVALV